MNVDGRKILFKGSGIYNLTFNAFDLTFLFLSKNWGLRFFRLNLLLFKHFGTACGNHRVLNRSLSVSLVSFLQVFFQLQVSRFDWILHLGWYKRVLFGGFTQQNSQVIFVGVFIFRWKILTFKLFGSQIFVKVTFILISLIEFFLGNFRIEYF